MTEKITVLALAGTGFPTSPDPITADFLSRLDLSRYETQVVPYPASFGGLESSFALSRVGGYGALLDALTKLGGKPAILAGYSQGAVIAGDLARDIATEHYPDLDLDIKACALIADGYRPRGTGITPAGHWITVAEGYGIAGERLIPLRPFPTFWVSAWGDPISALPAGNPLRTLADLVEWFSLESPTAAANWGAKMLDKVISGRLQDWWAPWKWEGWAGALAFARGYLFDGRHTTDYIELGYTTVLADTLNKLEFP